MRQTSASSRSFISHVRHDEARHGFTFDDFLLYPPHPDFAGRQGMQRGLVCVQAAAIRTS